MNRDIIIAAALEIARERTPLTVRSLGEHLNVDPTSFYRHFRGLDDLVAAVVDRSLAGLVDRVDPRAGWRERLRQLGEAAMVTAEEIPEVIASANRLTTGGPGERHAVEFALAAFVESGLPRAEAVRFYAMFSTHLVAVTAARAADLLARDLDGDDVPWVGDIGPIDERYHPHLAAARRDLAELRDMDIHMLGVDVILDAAAAAARKSRRTAS